MADIIGTEFDDDLVGTSDDDLIDGSFGADRMAGLGGNDTYRVDDEWDFVTEAAGEGNDTVETWVDYELGANVENLVYTGWLRSFGSEFFGTGNSLNNFLQGHAGDDWLDGADGADHMVGLAGDDTYDVDDAGDFVTESAGEGTDTLYVTLTSYTLGANLENLYYFGNPASAFHGTGNSLNNTMQGWNGDDVLDGAGGADVMIGFGGSDVYEVDNAGDVVREEVGEGIDTVNVTASSYTLSDNVEDLYYWGASDFSGTGNGLNNHISGGAGNDRLTGSGGDDTLVGGAGSDTAAYNDAGEAVVVSLELGIQDTRGGGIDTLSEIENLIGSAFDDQLTGTGGDNILEGGLGDDQLNGGVGYDVASYAGATGAVQVDLSSGAVTGAAGADTLVSFEGVAGSEFNDSLTGNSGINELSGGGGDDILEGGLGNDTLDGGDGSDIASYSGASGAVQVNLGTGAVSGAGGADILISINGATGSAFNDTLIGNSEGNELSGLDGADRLSGLGGIDWLNGGGGNDVLNGGADLDLMFGGAGDDSYYVDTSSDWASENENEGTDRVYSSANYTLGANVENITLIGTANVTALGNELGNQLIGNSGNNVIDGGVGADMMLGGGGDDSFYVDNSGDRASEGAAGGTDHVYSSVSFALWTNVENLTLTGTAALSGLGNAASNTLTGNAGNNVLNGYGGADTMLGGAGNDSYYVDSAGDQVSESPGDGTDWVYSSISFTLGTDVDNLILTGTALIGTGNAGSNTIFGNAGNNVINGGVGADMMLGGAGDDSFYVDDAGDRASEAAGGGTDHVYSSVSFALWANVENLTLTGTAALTGAGNAGSNTLTGNSGNNVLNGYGGADTMLGGAGNDSYYVDNVSDQVSENAGEGTDWVYSSIGFTLSSEVENLTLTGTGSSDATGNGQSNLIFGNAAVNNVTGAGGDDRLYGKEGKDVLTGGDGADGYYFDTTPHSVTNWDTIIDFSVADDSIYLNMGAFTELAGTGALDAGAFHQGTVSGDGDDRIIYDSVTGSIYYDADGNGAGAAVLFAQVTAGTALSEADFFAY